MTPPRAMLQLVPSGPAELLVDAVRSAGQGLDVTLMVRADDCFMGDAAPHCAAAEGSADALVELSRALGDTVDRDRSVALVGVDVVFLEPAPTPWRFQYLMRRRPDFTHDAYLRRYRKVHSEFGLRTPNIDGYVQFHVDPVLSTTLGRRAELHDPPFDSVSELHLRSVAHFVEGIAAHPEVSAGAQADEELFVDRPRSFGFVNRSLAE